MLIRINLEVGDGAVGVDAVDVDGVAVDALILAAALIRAAVDGAVGVAGAGTKHQIVDRLMTTLHLTMGDFSN